MSCGRGGLTLTLARCIMRTIRLEEAEARKPPMADPDNRSPAPIRIGAGHGVLSWSGHSSKTRRAGTVLARTSSKDWLISSSLRVS